MKNLTVLLFIILAFNSYSQKTFLDFRNESTPTYPGCENAENKEDCYRQKVGELILPAINAENKKNAFKQDTIKIEFLIRNEVSGKSTILKAKAEDPVIEQLVRSALEALPLIEPSFSPVDGKPGGSSYGFYVMLERDKNSKSYKLINKSTTEENRKKEHPFASYVCDLTFPGCEGTKPELLRSCFNEKFTEWLLGKADNKIITQHKGAGGSIKLTFDESGKLESYTVLCALDNLKKEFDRILATHPNVKPGKINGKSSKLTYSIPFTLK